MSKSDKFVTFQIQKSQICDILHYSTELEFFILKWGSVKLSVLYKGHKFVGLEKSQIFHFCW